MENISDKYKDKGIYLGMPNSSESPFKKADCCQVWQPKTSLDSNAVERLYVTRRDDLGQDYF